MSTKHDLLHISKVPLAVFNRALELFGEPEETTVWDAHVALMLAESRLDAPKRVLDGAHLTPFAVALAEYVSGGEGFYLSVSR